MTLLIGLLAILGAAGCSSTQNTTCPTPQASDSQRAIHIRSGELIMDQLGYKEVILTYDDGPAPGATRRVLDVLDQQCVAAVFFLRGDMASKHPRLVRELADRGHVIGSHGWAHEDLTTMSIEEAVDDVERAHTAIVDALPEDAAGSVSLFRYPYLQSTPELEQAIAHRGFISVGVSAIGSDWGNRASEDVVEILMTRLEASGNKGVILLHDPFRNAEKSTELLLARLKAENYSFVTLRPEIVSMHNASD